MNANVFSEYDIIIIDILVSLLTRLNQTTQDFQPKAFWLDIEDYMKLLA